MKELTDEQIQQFTSQVVAEIILGNVRKGVSSNDYIKAALDDYKWKQYLNLVNI